MMSNGQDTINKLINSGQYKTLNEGLKNDALVKLIIEKINDIDINRTKIISFIGGPASGKTSIVDHLVKALSSVAVISTDDYVVGTRQERRRLEQGDARSKYDIDLLNKKVKDICQLEDGVTVKVPTYDGKSGLAVAVGEENYSKEIGRVDVLIVEGDFNFIEAQDLLIYLHVPDNIRLQNRIRRDTVERSQPDIKELTDNFNYRQLNQFWPYTLPVAERSDLLLTVTAKERGNWFEYFYTVYLRK
ncbi:MAG: hypothetical protein V1838_03060 [Patescibacteria group bacterium]